jgi:hypothetical protein
VAAAPHDERAVRAGCGHDARHWNASWDANEAVEARARRQGPGAGRTRETVAVAPHDDRARSG